MAVLLASVHPVHIAHLLRALHKSRRATTHLPSQPPLLQLLVHRIHGDHIARGQRHHHCRRCHRHHQMRRSLSLTPHARPYHLRVQVQVRRQRARRLVVAEEQQVPARPAQTTPHLSPSPSLHLASRAQRLAQRAALLPELLAERRQERRELRRLLPEARRQHQHHAHAARLRFSQRARAHAVSHQPVGRARARLRLQLHVRQELAVLRFTPPARRCHVRQEALLHRLAAQPARRYASDPADVTTLADTKVVPENHLIAHTEVGPQLCLTAWSHADEEVVEEEAAEANRGEPHADLRHERVDVAAGGGVRREGDEPVERLNMRGRGGNDAKAVEVLPVERG